MFGAQLVHELFIERAKRMPVSLLIKLTPNMGYAAKNKRRKCEKNAHLSGTFRRWVRK
jgi:hypothetical protein